MQSSGSVAQTLECYSVWVVRRLMLGRPVVSQTWRTHCVTEMSIVSEKNACVLRSLWRQTNFSISGTFTHTLTVVRYRTLPESRADYEDLTNLVSGLTIPESIKSLSKSAIKDNKLNHLMIFCTQSYITLRINLMML